MHFFKKMDKGVNEKCLVFCQGLVNDKAQFSFNLSIGKDNNLNFKNNESEKTEFRRRNHLARLGGKTKKG